MGRVSRVLAKITIFQAAFFLFVLGLLLGVFVWVTARKVETLSSGSPTSNQRIYLEDTVLVIPSIDRSCRIILEDLVTHHKQTIFRLPDDTLQSKGRERFLWDKSGTKVLLIGKGFYTTSRLNTAQDESPYFLYDLTTGGYWVCCRNRSVTDNELTDVMVLALDLSTQFFERDVDSP